MNNVIITSLNFHELDFNQALNRHESIEVFLEKEYNFTLPKKIVLFLSDDFFGKIQKCPEIIKEYDLAEIRLVNRRFDSSYLMLLDENNNEMDIPKYRDFDEDFPILRKSSICVTYKPFYKGFCASILIVNGYSEFEFKTNIF